MMGSRILLDSVMENGGSVYASSQTGAITTEINRDNWTGAAKIYPSGIYNGHEAKNIRVKITGAKDYDESMANYVPVPTQAIYGSGNTGRGTVTMSTYNTWPGGSHAGLYVVLTRSGSNWTGNFYSGLDPDTAIAITVDSDNWTFSSGGNDYFKIVTTDSLAADWADGDTVRFYAFQAKLKVSTDGGVIYGDDMSIFPSNLTWCDGDFVLSLTNGFSIRIVLSGGAVQAFQQGDYFDVTAGYEYGLDQLFTQPRTELWQSKEAGYQCIFVDYGENKTVDMLAVLDRLGTVALFHTTSAALIGTCTGELASVSASPELTIDGDTWSDDIDGGKLWITSGEAMGKYYTINAVSDPDVTLSSNPATDGAVAGDRYLIIPDSELAAKTFGSNSTGDIKYFTSTTARGFWIRFYSSSLSYFQASKIRIGQSLAPDVAPLHMGERALTPRDFRTESATGVINNRAVGYAGDLYPVNYELMDKDDRDDLIDELKTYISPQYARFMLYVPYTGDSSNFLYGRVTDIKHKDLNRLWAAFMCQIEVSPHA